MRYLLSLLLFCLPAVLFAQDDPETSGGFIADLLQDSLSGENRSVRIVGLDGALGSRATIETITVSDDRGVWITISKAELDWNRLALVSKRLEVNTLKADEIIVERLPDRPADGAELPAAEATVFRVPDLPVSVDIGELSVKRLVLGESVAGLAVELETSAKLSLAGGNLATTASVVRLDRTSDRADVIAEFSNETRRLNLNLSLIEAPGGLVSKILNLPGQPAVEFSVKGDGPVSDYRADIVLATDGRPRLGGQVRLRGTGDLQTGAGAGTGFIADVSGDLTPLLAREYRSFFGESSRLAVAGHAGADGALDIREFRLKTGAADLSGTLGIAAGGQIENLSLSGEIAPPRGESLTLPMPGAQTVLQHAEIAAHLDSARGNLWTLDATVSGLGLAELSIGRVRFSGRGTLDQSKQSPLEGMIDARLDGLAFTDAALQQAAGDTVKLSGQFAVTEDNTLKLDGFELGGTGYSARVSGTVAGLATGFSLLGKAQVGVSDMARLSGLAGRQLGGTIEASIEGRAAPLGGSFDLRLEARMRDASTGIARVDSLIGGATAMVLDAARGTGGTEIRRFEIDGDALTGRASGTLSSQSSAMTVFARLDDMARLTGSLNGPLTLAGEVRQKGERTTGTVRVRGPNASFFDLDGSLDRTGAADIGYSGRINRLDRFLPDIAGNLTAEGQASRTPLAQWRVSATTGGSAGLDGRINASFDENSGAAIMRFNVLLDRLERLLPGLSGNIGLHGRAARDAQQGWKLNAVADGTAGLAGTFRAIFSEINTDAEIYFDASVERIQRIVGELSGTVQAAGLATRSGTVWDLDTKANGPGGLTADVSGTFDQGAGHADIGAKGQVQLGLANPIISPNTLGGVVQFDLNLRGQPALDALSGTIATTRSSIAIPNMAQTLTNINATAAISDGRAEISATGGPRTGGTLRVQGSMDLHPPFNANLRTDLTRVVVTDNISVVSSADGQLVMAGPLAGGATISGQINFGETEINIAAASGSVSAAPIPEITHIGEPSGVRTTRARAGLLAGNGAGTGPVYALDILLNAPNRVFARGRGLNAELGGQVQVRGNSDQVVPSGEISLIRGTFDILGRRLTLDGGQVSLQGQLEPFLNLFASTATSEGEATLSITGPASSPVIEVTSVPERPSEEALAMLLLGDQFTELSPLRVAQLAAQLSELSGREGFFGKLRRKLGLVSLDVGTTEDGTAQVGAGTYLTDDVYTDVTVNAEGESEINLNLDVTDTLMLKGSVDDQGNTGVGIFFQRDY